MGGPFHKGAVRYWGPKKGPQFRELPNWIVGGRCQRYFASLLRGLVIVFGNIKIYLGGRWTKTPIAKNDQGRAEAETQGNVGALIIRIGVSDIF